MLTSQVATFALSKGKGARSQIAKNKTELFPSKIGRGILNLVALALTVTEFIQQSVRKGLERKKELRRQVKNKTYPPPPPMGIRNRKQTWSDLDALLPQLEDSLHKSNCSGVLG